MKTSSLQKTGISPKAMLGAASISLLAMAPSAEAVVTWQVYEVGGHVHAATTGSLVLPSSVFTTTSGGNSGGGAGPNSFGFWDAAHIDDPVGTGFGTGYVLDYVPYATSLISGDWFFVYFSEVHYGGAWDSTPDFQTRTATPNTVIDLGPGSISTFFGTNLDSGPRTIWSGGTGDTVQIAAVPEPSTLLLLPSAMLSCLVRSRRRK